MSLGGFHLENQGNRAKINKCRLAIALGLVIVMVVPFYYVGPFTAAPAKVEEPSGFIEPKAATSGFPVTDLSIQPAEVESNEIVTITVSVANTQDTSGIYSLVLKINGVKEAEKQANIDAKSSQDVSFSVTRDNLGRITLYS